MKYNITIQCGGIYIDTWYAHSLSELQLVLEELHDKDLDNDLIIIKEETNDK